MFVYLDFPTRRSGRGLLDGDLEYDLLRLGPGGGRLRLGDGDFENDLDRDRLG